MDSHTLELLEFPKILELLATYALTSLGKEKARQTCCSTDRASLEEELDLVSEMRESLAEGLAPPLAGLRDVRLLIRRAAIGSMLTAGELLEVKDVLACTGQVYRYRMRLPPQRQRLIELLGRVEDLGAVARSIEGCVDSRGTVLDMASRELAAIRQRLRELDEKAQTIVKRLLRDPELRKILRYPNATMSGDHYVFPVSVNQRHKLPGVVHRTSSTGETLYVEPASLAQLSAERAILKVDEEKETHRVLRRLTAEVAQVARPLHVALDTLAHLDLLQAKARFSLDFAMTRPTLGQGQELWLRQARHPLLIHLFRQEAGSPAGQPRQVVPIDVHLGRDFRLLVITGPNTGGKTVALKTVGLLCLMAQAGMHIPAAEGSQVPLLHRVLADIGDEQSLEQSLSTFSSHMSRIADILRVADERSLVLLDELGAGTDPTEGAALGRAILDELDRLGCLALVTTHLGDLKTYALSNPRAENAAVEFDASTLRPTYRLLIGQFGMSNALKIARRLKLPRSLIQRAHRYLRRHRRGVPLDRWQQLRQEAEKARQQAYEAQLAAERERVALQRQKAELDRQAEAAAALQAARQRLAPGDPVQVPRLRTQGQIVRVDLKRQLAVVQAGLGQWEVSLEEVIPLSSVPPDQAGS
jgi:DNA mismatch repair protein MutS2